MNLKEQLKNQRAVITSMSIVLVVLVIAIAGASYAWAHQDRFYRGVTIGSVPVGGLSFEDGRTRVHGQLDQILNSGAQVQVEGETRTVALSALSPDDPDLTRDLVYVDIDQALEHAKAVGRQGNMGTRVFDSVGALIFKRQVLPNAVVDEDAMELALIETFAEFYEPAIEPAFLFEGEDDDLLVIVEPGSPGRAFDVQEAVRALTENLSRLQDEVLILAVQDQEPTLSTQDAMDLIERAEASLERAPYTLTYAPSRFETYTYNIDQELLRSTLAPQAGEDGPELGLNEQIEALFAQVAEEINVEPQNARFQTDGARVEEFQPSKPGREVDTEATYSSLVTALNQEETNEEGEEDSEREPIEIAVNETQAEITTASVNDLGITEVLGVGVSDFSGSPANRVANIRHGISKLNGLLIAPDEEFSLIAALKPFTIADGYLPELVIKGDEIKPEVGGGLCQIGSTTFRAVMNSGLPVTQRRNHSLVVNYYNDPSNGNPGTDATLYDPAPDFRFVNDTGNYILLTTEMDASTGYLGFTFWGTSDGRKGYYSAPVVHNWIGTGPTRTTYTTSLPPGVRQCQGAHPGANTSFTYTVEQADGTVEERVFESYYRPLPTICLVGVAEGSLDEDGNLIEEPETDASNSSGENSEEAVEDTSEDATVSEAPVTEEDEA